MDEPELPPPQPADATLEAVEREHILATLRRHEGNRTATAAELGISRRTLQYKLGEYQRQGFEVDER
jgi:two-component system response regulator FlrC